MTRGRSKLVALAAMAALALSACSLHQPGTAAVVGNETITVNSADQFANAMCTAFSGQSSGPTATRQMRITAVQILVEAAASKAYGESLDVPFDANQLNNAMQQNQTLFNAVDADYRDEFSSLVEDYIRGQLMLITLGHRELNKQGQTTADDQTALTTGLQLLQKNGPKVEVDPRFGTYANGVVTPASGSLSVPVSSFATSDGNLNDSSWIASLPAFQKCG